jgi:hypothetical protein
LVIIGRGHRNKSHILVAAHVRDVISIKIVVLNGMGFAIILNNDHRLTTRRRSLNIDILCRRVYVDSIELD